MADVLTPLQRSHCMSRIRRTNTLPELKLRNALWKLGLRYRKSGNYIGRPDIVFPGRKLAIFIDGCFWHQCPQHFKPPKTNSEFWANKISRNVRRDRDVVDQLANAGWIALRFWEHDIKNNFDATLDLILGTVNGIDNKQPKEID